MITMVILHSDRGGVMFPDWRRRDKLETKDGWTMTVNDLETAVTAVNGDMVVRIPMSSVQCWHETADKPKAR